MTGTELGNRPAFPTVPDNVIEGHLVQGQSGMSTRAYMATKFAGELIGVAMLTMEARSDLKENDENIREIIAETACHMADTLLAQLSKPPQ